MPNPSVMAGSVVTVNSARPTSSPGLMKDLARINRELVCGASFTVLLRRLADLALTVFDVQLGGIFDQTAATWHLPTGAPGSMAQRLDRAAETADPNQWVVSVTLEDDGRVLGHLTLVAATAGRSAGSPLDAADIEALTEMCTLVLLGTYGPTHRSAPLDPREMAVDSALVSDMRRDLAAGRFVPHFQPIIELSTESVVGFEALVRWNHPARGWIRAADFIDQAEQANLTAELQAVVFRQAAERARGWLDRGVKRVRVNLKLSTRQLESPLLLDDLKRLTETYRLPTSSLGLLLTEPMLTAAATRGAVQSLRNSGHRVTLERFTPTRSSTETLRGLPLHALKIDRGIVSRLGVDPSASDEARSVIQMARTLDLHSVADGVETEAQRAALAELGCESALGFLWSAAVESGVANSMMQFQPFASRLAKRRAPGRTLRR